MRPIVTNQVAWSVFGLCVTLVNPAKTAKPIEMLFGLRTQVGPRNRVLDGGSTSPHGKGQFWGKGQPIVKYRDTLPWAVQEQLNQLRCRLGYWLGWAKEACIRWGPDPSSEGTIHKGKYMPGMPNDTLPWAVQKWLNRSICRLGYGLRLAWREHKRNRIRQLKPMYPHGRTHLHTVRLQQRCGLMSNYFDHLLDIGCP